MNLLIIGTWKTKMWNDQILYSHTNPHVKLELQTNSQNGEHLKHDCLEFLLCYN